MSPWVRSILRLTSSGSAESLSRSARSMAGEESMPWMSPPARTGRMLGSDVASSGNNARHERLLSARDRLAALLSRWRARHPAAALERLERFVPVMQGLAPRGDDPPGQRPELLRFPGLSARPWYENDRFPWIEPLERRWRETRAELDAL